MNSTKKTVDKDLAQELAPLLKDGDQNIRYNAVQLLCSAGDAGTPYLLAVVKDKDADANARSLALSGLSSSKEFVPILKDLMKDSDANGRRIAVQHLYSLNKEGIRSPWQGSRIPIPRSAPRAFTFCPAFATMRRRVLPP